MKKSERTKEELIHVVIQLIEENNSTEMTISTIAKKADVAVGLINYYYSGKQDLIIDAVKTSIEERIQEDNVLMPKEFSSEYECLVASLQSYADFLTKHSTICRLHIQYCLEGSINNDSVTQATQYYIPMMKKADPSLDDEKAMTVLLMAISTIQQSFLQAKVANAVNGFDFYQKDQRDHLIEAMLSLTLGGRK